EGLGIVLLEAMASGLPVVSTACGGPESAVEHERTGLLTPVGDAQSLAAAMGRMCSEASVRIRMGEEARKSVVKGFSIASASRAFITKYEETLTGKRTLTASAAEARSAVFPGKSLTTARDSLQ